MNKRVAVIGQGYVGLPIALSAAKAGYLVTGIDNDMKLVEKLNSGISMVEDISNSQIENQISAGSYIATSNYSEAQNCQVILVCVPTPLSNGDKPNLDILISAVTSVGKFVSKGSLVIIESTVAPGTTRDLVLPILEKESRLKSNNFHVVFSPERIDPQNKIWNLKNTPKLVAGLTQESCNMAVDFYSKFIEKLIVCESIEVAETAKLLENSFRLVNISFINELLIFCDKLGINIDHVVKAASTKPYGFMPFYPSLGIGGHCIPVDPIYLSDKAREIGARTRLIDLADQINDEMPGYFVGRAEEKLGGVKNKKVLVVGVSYKPNVSDIRETPVEALILGLKQKGAKVFWHDDLVKEWNGEKSVTLSSDFDLAILATPHDYIDLSKLGKVPILNTRGSI